MQDVNGSYIAPPPFLGFNAFALGTARILFLVVAIGGLVSLRVVAGLMLALGPFFVAFLLFSNTRSLFEGWIRVIAGAALSSLALSILLGMQLMLIEPWLSQALARRLAGQSLPSLPSDLMVITCLFAILIFAALFATIRLAGAFRLAPVLELIRSTVPTGSLVQSSQPVKVNKSDSGPRSRSELIADHLATTQLRERSSPLQLRNGRLAEQLSSPARISPSATPQRDAVRTSPSMRRTRHRTSASAARRDTSS
jgi:type IV secretion system protein VirB6